MIGRAVSLEVDGRTENDPVRGKSSLSASKVSDEVDKGQNRRCAHNNGPIKGIRFA